MGWNWKFSCSFSHLPFAFSPLPSPLPSFFHFLFLCPLWLWFAKCLNVALSNGINKDIWLWLFVIFTLQCLLFEQKMESRTQIPSLKKWKTHKVSIRKLLNRPVSFCFSPWVTLRIWTWVVYIWFMPFSTMNKYLPLLIKANYVKGLVILICHHIISLGSCCVASFKQITLKLLISSLLIKISPLLPLLLKICLGKATLFTESCSVTL